MKRDDDTQASLEARVQATIVSDITGTTLPLITLLLAILSVVGIATRQPMRAVAAGVFFVAALTAWWASRRGRVRLASRAYILGAVASILMASVLNGGLLAPVMTTMIASIVLVGWLMGRDGTTWAALAASGAVAVLTLLMWLGWLPEAAPAPTLQRAVATLFAVWLAWAGTFSPQRRLRTALDESLRREQELVAAEERRRQSELAFEAVFEQAGQLMLLLEPGGVLVRANRAAVALLGAKGELAVGQSLVDTLRWPQAELAKLAMALERAATAPQPLQVQVSDGAGRSFDLTVSQVRGRVIVQGRDISPLLAEQDREARSRRLALVGQLAGGVAHDFNNVLAVTLSSAEAVRDQLRDQGQLTPELDEHLESITSVTGRAADLTRRLLTFGRRAPMTRQVRSMHELISSMQKLLQRTLPANIVIRAELNAPQDLVDADAASVESVLLNLAINARDAMPSGGTLTLRTERVVLDEAACRASDFELTPGPYLRLTVADTGTGIAPELLGRVFEPFFTTKAEGKGSGIGLSSVLGAMQEHRGAVSVESALGQGTRFHLFFPLAQAAPVEAPARPTSTDLGGLVALVVDDEPQLRSLVTRQLKRLGVEAVVAETAEAGWALYQAEPARFHFAVLDIVLPGRSGSELAKDLLVAPEMKVLLVSGYPRDADLGALPRDRARLLSKPFTAEGLRAAITQLLGR